MEKKKKPYEKPELKGKIVFESSGAMCCKLTNGTCSNANKDSYLPTVKARATNTS